MIRIQPTTSDSNLFLIGSDLTESSAAAQEIGLWIEENNCRLPENPRRLSVYEDGILVREWVLVERCPEAMRQEVTPKLFMKFWQRRAASNAAPVSTCETIHLRFDDEDETVRRAA
jgi:hypothetical protein